MGDRISIQFVNGDDKSVVFFDHWAGRTLVQEAQEYLVELNAEIPDSQVSMPLDRREPSVVIMDFIAWRATKHGFNPPMHRIQGSWYLGADENDGDNSDNGHFLIDVRKRSKSEAQPDPERMATNWDKILDDLPF